MTSPDLAASLGNRFSTHYSLWGTKLNLDRLLTDARPHADYEVWRRGDPTALETPAVTAGLRIEVFDGNSAEALETAVKRFVKREARFLQAARSRARTIDHSGLTTMISVGSSEEIPIGLELSAFLLGVIAKAQVAWTVTVSVFADATGRPGETSAK